MLSDLNLRSNRLSGEIPDELGNLTDLRVLNLHSNYLSGDIPDLSNTKLDELYLANNYDGTVAGSGLTGPVPAWLNGMTDMRELWLWGNRLSRTIPDLSGMTSLQKLKLASNNLSGGAPKWLGSMSSLRWLVIQDNSLSGEIPAELGKLSKLTNLWLNSNQLMGTIPRELGGLAQAREMATEGQPVDRMRASWVGVGGGQRPRKPRVGRLLRALSGRIAHGPAPFLPA